MAGVGSAVRRLYLSIYNWVVFYGWCVAPLPAARFYLWMDLALVLLLRWFDLCLLGSWASCYRAQVLYYAVMALRESGHEAVYPAIERPLQFAQTAAIMETQTHILVTSLVISWSITEIIRYSFFGMKEALGFAPSWLLWLRYSTFLVLYPTGITSEVGLIYIALPFMKASEKYCLRMPNKWNFSFDYSYGSILAMAIYVPGSPHMYNYMRAQRKKALSKAKAA
ncbi:hypothetical protein PR202_gb26443 [Eleusine coracana subsp. coracana]|uniref:Very-long-chain (3R)-3-hydroxyacyl-CoA dehydratase n=1 Tax=Eleusine coracana subsp. coracana TaxID=191504 RepID=A0AAV5FP84_ELECO|nr:hypothetical protein PR202_gb26443 [Eleusine coracana subsp. coracana]